MCALAHHAKQVAEFNYLFVMQILCRKEVRGREVNIEGYNNNNNNQSKTSNLPTISTNVQLKKICNNHICRVQDIETHVLQRCERYSKTCSFNSMRKEIRWEYVGPL